MFWKTLASVGAVVLCVLGSAYAENYPERPIVLVVPFPPGGGTDALARLVGQKMSESLGQPVVVENRPGGAGTVGTRGVAKSRPDGYTILIGFTGTFAIGPTLFASAGIDPVKDFEPIGQISSLPILLVVNSTSKFQSLRELLQYAKENPGKLNYASSGNGTTTQIAMEMLLRAADVKITHVPYRGTGEAVTGLLGGHVDIFLSTVGAGSGFINEGKLRPLAALSPARLQMFPNVPTLAELGYSGVSGMSIYGLVAPAGTPRGIIERLNVALNEALKSPDISNRLIVDAGSPLPGSPEDYGRDMKADAEYWGRLVNELGLKLN